MADRYLRNGEVAENADRFVPVTIGELRNLKGTHVKQDYFAMTLKPFESKQSIILHVDNLAAIQSYIGKTAQHEPVHYAIMKGDKCIGISSELYRINNREPRIVPDSPGSVYASYTRRRKQKSAKGILSGHQVEENICFPVKNASVMFLHYLKEEFRRAHPALAREVLSPEYLTPLFMKSDEGQPYQGYGSEYFSPTTAYGRFEIQTVDGIVRKFELQEKKMVSSTLDAFLEQYAQKAPAQKKKQRKA